MSKRAETLKWVFCPNKLGLVVFPVRKRLTVSARQLYSPPVQAGCVPVGVASSVVLTGPISDNLKMKFSCARIAGCVIVAAAALALFGCKLTKPIPANNEKYDLNRPPVEAPASVKASDFRLSPPEVQNFSIKKLNQSSALVMVQFAPDKRLGRRVTVTTADGPIVLRDDGREGDEKAGDGVYSAVVSMNVDALVADQEAALKQLAEVANKKGPLRIHRFHGRDIVGEEILDVKALDAELRRDIIPLHWPPPPGPWLVDAPRSLFITDTNVVGDTTRTFDLCNGIGTPMGKWTFGYLMTQMANQSQTGIDPSDFVLNWLTNWLGDQAVNGFTVSARPNMQNLINQWPKLPNGKLDLANAPMKLLAIVNRIDLAANSAYGPVSGAEGRFIFAPEIVNTNFQSSFCAQSNFNVILEYGLPASSSCGQIRSWAQQWLGLQNFTLGSAQYNAALEAITDQFTAANVSPSRPNGSALDQLRTDEIALAGAWQLREFHLNSTDHLLHEATLAQTPDQGTYNGTITPPGPSTADLGCWINQNSASVTANTYTVPLQMQPPCAPVANQPFRAGEVTNQINFWNATGITLEVYRHNVSLNTCNACHGAETGTAFTQAFANAGGAGLSGFLTGINNVTIPVNGPPDPNGNPTYSYNDLERRQQVLWADAHSFCLFFTRVPVILMAH